MVRYPKKTIPLAGAVPVEKPKELPVVQSQPSVSPPSKASVATPPIADDKIKKLNEQIHHDEIKVRNLNAQIHELEVKLKDIQGRVASPGPVKTLEVKKPNRFARTLNFSWLNRKLLTKIVPIVFGLVILAWILPLVWKFFHPPFEVSWTVTNEYKDYKIRGVDFNLTPEDYQRLAWGDGSETRILKEVLPWPSLIKGQDWLLSPVTLFYNGRIDVSKAKAPASFAINVRGHDEGEIKSWALAVEKIFVQQYVKTRQQVLRAALESIENQIQQLRQRLSADHKKMDTYPPLEHVVVVSTAMRQGMDRVMAQDTLELEDDFAQMKQEIKKGFAQYALPPKPSFDEALFRAYQLRLFDLELRKFLIPSDAMASFAGGVQVVKEKIADMVNAYYENTPQSMKTAAATIKAVFLKAKFDALECLLNKHYAEQSALSGRKAEYATLRLDAQKLLVDYEYLLTLKSQILDDLKGDLSKEVKGQWSVHKNIE